MKNKFLNIFSRFLLFFFIIYLQRKMIFTFEQRDTFHLPMISSPAPLFLVNILFLLPNITQAIEKIRDGRCRYIETTNSYIPLSSFEFFSMYRYFQVSWIENFSKLTDGCDYHKDTFYHWWVSYLRSLLDSILVYYRFIVEI